MKLPLIAFVPKATRVMLYEKKKLRHMIAKKSQWDVLDEQRRNHDRDIGRALRKF